MKPLHQRCEVLNGIRFQNAHLTEYDIRYLIWDVQFACNFMHHSSDFYVWISVRKHVWNDIRFQNAHLMEYDIRCLLWDVQFACNFMHHCSNVCIRMRVIVSMEPFDIQFDHNLFLHKHQLWLPWINHVIYSSQSHLLLAETNDDRTTSRKALFSVKGHPDGAYCAVVLILVARNFQISDCWLDGSENLTDYLLIKLIQLVKSTEIHRKNGKYNLFPVDLARIARYDSSIFATFVQHLLSERLRLSDSKCWTNVEQM